MEIFLIFPWKPLLAGGNSLLEPRNQLMHTDATFGTCDKWNYALEWYQVVLGSLRVNKNIFTKIAMSEVNFSHRPKITILWVGASWSKMHPFSTITIRKAYVVWIWRLYDYYKIFRTPKSVHQISAIWRLFSGSILPNYWNLLGVKNSSKAHGARFQFL